MAQISAEINMEQTCHEMFKLFDGDTVGELTAPYIQAAHEMIRIGGISLQQVEASMLYVCVDPNVCEEWEFIELLKEMDRRYYLIQNFRWEFSLLDTEMTDTITVEQARWFMQSVHGQHFSRQRWDTFLKKRPAPHTSVSFPEIEVELCNVPCMTDVMDELEKEKLKKQEEARLKKLHDEEKKRMKEKLARDRRKLQEEQKRLQDDKEQRERESLNKLEEERRRQDEEEAKKLAEEEEQKRREEEKERRRLEKEEEGKRKQAEQEMVAKLKREEEERRKKAEEEALNIEATAREAAMLEKEAEQLANEAMEKRQNAEDAKSQKKLEEAEAAARRRQAEMKEKRIRANLKVAIKTKNRDSLHSSLKDFKKAKLHDFDLDVPKAEDILKLLDARDGLKKAMKKRDLKTLEEAMNHVRRGGFETELQREMIEANQLLLRLRRLERIRAEILELKQSTVAEIRSYQSPPPIVHSVMIGTFLILGHQEKECKEWKKVQALVGKTGKEGLKRRCLEYDPASLAKKMEISAKAKSKMSKFELDDVRDVSAGAATFYLWATNMIEEAEMIAEQED